MTRWPELPTDDLDWRDLSFHAIRRWRLVLIGALGLLLLGLLGWLDIPRREEPAVQVPLVTVDLAYPGASPRDMETKVLKSVEASLYSLDGVDYVESTAFANGAELYVRFQDGVDMDVATEKVRGRILSLKQDLPAELKDPEVAQWSTSLAPAMVLAVAGPLDGRDQSRQARRLKGMLETVPGVAGVDLLGEFKPAVRVRLDPLRLARHRLTADEVARQLRAANVRLPGGALDAGPYTTLLEVDQAFQDIASVGRVPVGAVPEPTGSTRTVRLEEVADVLDASLEPAQRFMCGGPAVGLALRFRSGENGIQVGRAVHARLAREQSAMPPGIRLEVVHDQPEWVRQSMAGFVSSLLEGVALVLLVVTLGLGLRSGLVVAGVIPLAVGGAVAGLDLLGFSLDLVSLGGLIVALGLLVDDAVVVTESVAILRGKGLGAVRAAVFGTARVFRANNGTTAVTLAAFLPLFAMGGDTGRYIRALPVAVVLALATSLAVAQLLTPWLATWMLKRPPGVAAVADDVPWPRTEDQSEAPRLETSPALGWLRERYLRLIPWVVAHPGRVVAGASAALALALALFPMIGFEFFPRADKPVLFVGLELATGERLERTAAALSQATALLGTDPDVAATSGVAGGSYPPVYTAHRGPGTGTHVAELLVRLRQGCDVTAAGQRVRRLLADLPGVLVDVADLSYGPPLQHPVLVRISGPDHAVLGTAAAAVRARLAAIPGTLNVRDSLGDSLPLTRIDLDPDRARRAGITPAQVGAALRTLHGEDTVTDFRQGEDTVAVVLEQPAEGGRPFAALEETPIPVGDGRTVPLKQSGSAGFEAGLARLSRRNTQRVVEVTCDLAPGTLAGTVTGQLDPWLRSRAWPAGTSYDYGGAAEQTRKSFRMLAASAAGALLLIFLLLLLLFDSLLLSGLVLLLVPYVLVGALPGLALTGNAFGFMAFLGLITLIGVYVNHKIYFVDRMLELMRRGESLASALGHAGADRLRPVVLTALTAVLGLVPLTLSGRLWAAFGWVNIFGLLASIPLSLILLPAWVALAWRITGRTPAPGGSR